MSDPTYLELLETSWRRPLTEGERSRLQAILSADPAAAADWQAEQALGGLLQRLPTPSLSSNFTAQVRRAIEAGAARGAAGSWQSRAREWAGACWPKAAWAAGLALLATATLQEYRHLDRTRLVRDLAQLHAAGTVPAPEVLLDFDTIWQLNSVAPEAKMASAVSDDDLVRAFQ
jgi:hypothetical protein